MRPPPTRTLAALLGSLTLACGTRREASIPAAWLADVTDEAGIDFVHESGATGGLHLPEIMGGGAAFLDYDGDGDLDVYLTNGNSAPDGGPAATIATSRLYRQDPGGKFVERTRESGLGDPGYGMGLAAGDVDNDGDIDLFVANFGKSRLYVNRGGGVFEDASRAAGVDVTGFATSAVFCDYDQDGFLDLYVARYVRYDPRRVCHDSAGRRDYCTPIGYEAESDVLLHNEGNGTFTDGSAAAGLTGSRTAGLGVVCDDFDDDGRPDFYVANDKYANQLWLNQGGGTFRDQAVLRGAAYNLEGRARAGMGVAAADLDGDADLDLCVTNLETEGTTLYRNLGGGLFEDATATFDLVLSTVPYTGFGVVAADVEADGDLDLLVANGRVLRRVADRAPADPWSAYAEHSLLLLSTDGARFDPRPDLAGAFGSEPAVSRGLAAGDFDDDGDLDLLVARAHGRARLYRNDAPRVGRTLVVRTVDPRYHRDAIGARVHVLAGGRRFVRTITAGSSYLSSHDPRAHFGLGPIERIDRVEVRWPDGLRESFQGAEPDRPITLARGSGTAIER